MTTSPRRIVVKCGTRLLTGDRGLNETFIRSIARQIAAVRRDGTQGALVTSGAVAAGRSIVSLDGDGLVMRQVLAAIGHAPLMACYSERFGAEGITVAQALLSRADLASRSGYLNARNALNGLLDADVLAIANENDVVATEELRFGDNDALSVLIAKLIGADRLCLLSNTEGMFTADPGLDGSAELIPDLSEVPFEELERIAGDASDGGSGGMRSKVRAVLEAASDGSDAVIADGNAPDVLVRIERGEQVGTRSGSRGPVRSSRARWLSSSLAQRGEIIVDLGARRAIVDGGRSLLPAGRVAVEGEFERGDLVAVSDSGRVVFARGLVNYDATDLRRLVGLPSDAIAMVLGFSNGAEVVHRNNLVVMEHNDGDTGQAT